VIGIDFGNLGRSELVVYEIDCRLYAPIAYW
jgi:hypothetical protein